MRARVFHRFRKNVSKTIDFTLKTHYLLRIFSEAQNLNFSRVFIIPNFSQQKNSEFLLFFKIAPNLGSPEAVFWTKCPFPP